MQRKGEVQEQSRWHRHRGGAAGCDQVRWWRAPGGVQAAQCSQATIAKHTCTVYRGHCLIGQSSSTFTPARLHHSRLAHSCSRDPVSISVSLSSFVINVLQVAYMWAVSLGGDEGSQMLARAGLLDQVTQQDPVKPVLQHKQCRVLPPPAEGAESVLSGSS